MQVGSLVAYLDLDDTNFDRKTRNANKQIDGLELNLQALGKLAPELKLKTEAASAKAKALKDRLAELKVAMASAEDPAEVRVETAVTMMKLAAVKAEIRALHREAATPLVVSVDQSALSKLSADLDGVSKKLKGIGTGGLFGTALAVGPALAPFGGAAVGMLGGITSAATEAVSAVGVLALALKGVSGASSAYTAYQSATASANNSYAQALAAASGKTGKARASAIASANQSRSKALGTAQFNLNQSEYGKSSAATQQFVKFDQTQLHPFGAGLAASAQAGVLPGLTSGLQALIKDSPAINSAIQTIGNSVGNLASEAGHALNSPFWKQWLTWFGKDTAKNVGTMGHSVGMLIEALARMDQRSGGAGKIVTDLDHLTTRLNNWSASPAFLSFLQHIRTDEAEASKFLHALWTDLDPILKGLASTGGAELQLLTGALGIISHLPTGWLETAGKWLPIIFLSLKLANGPLASVSAGLSNVTKSIDDMTAKGMTKTEIFKTGFLNAMKAVSGAAGIGLLIDSTTHATSGLDTLESVAGGAAVGFSVGGPLGAAVGGMGGLFLSAVKYVHGLSHELQSGIETTDDVAKHYSDLATTLDQVTLTYTATTRAAALADAKKPGKNGAESDYKILHTAGFSDRQITDVALGTMNKQTKARLDALVKQQQQLLAIDQMSPAANKGPVIQGDKSTLAALEGMQGSGHRAQVKQAHDNAINAVLDLNQITKALGNAAAAQAIYNSDTGNTSKGMADLLEKFGGLKKFNGTQIKTLIQLEGGPSALLSYQGVVTQMRDDANKGITVPINADTRAAVTAINNVLGAFLPINLPGSSAPKSTTTGKPKVGHNAMGTSFWPGGVTWLNERGPELVNLPRGSQVVPYARSVQLTHGGGLKEKSDGYLRLHPDDIRAIGDHIKGGTQNLIDNSLIWES